MLTDNTPDRVSIPSKVVTLRSLYGLCPQGTHATRFMMMALLVGSALLLGACSRDRDQPYREREVTEIYNEALSYLDERQFRYSAMAFDEVERQHPYSAWARRAQLMSAYSYYMANRYEDAVLAAERFLALHPGNRNAAYAYYLIALSHYEQISDVGRDQRMTERALRALNEVVRRFPDTDYARDAQLKIELTRDHLAGKEMEIGRFYLNSQEYLAAIGRFRTVVEEYETTTHTPEALHRLTEAFLALGLREEARRSAAVLGYNFADSKWYEYSYELMTDRRNRASRSRPRSSSDQM